MSFYGNMIVKHVKAETEAGLEKELRKLEIAHDNMIKVISIYMAASGYTAWYYHDTKKAAMTQTTQPKITKKKVTKKKVTKKVK